MFSTANMTVEVCVSELPRLLHLI